MATASRVLEMSQVQMLGPLPQEEYSITRDEVEVHGDHFSLKWSLLHPSLNFYTIPNNAWGMCQFIIAETHQSEV